MSQQVQDTIALEQAAERLRQERETFDQRKQQDRHWFILRLAMGWVAVVLLPTIISICSWIILNYSRFDPGIVTLASAALLTDTLGLVISVWRIVVGKRGPEVLSPVTQASIKRST
jgi:hypothetical protein